GRERVARGSSTASSHPRSGGDRYVTWTHSETRETRVARQRADQTSCNRLVPRRYAGEVVNPERRSEKDRRQRRRGGRREGDASGTILLVLVVTSNERERDRVQFVLQDAGFAVVLCESAFAALQAARDLVPDVI